MRTGINQDENNRSQVSVQIDDVEIHKWKEEDLQLEFTIQALANEFSIYRSVFNIH